jgi:hypothetical protein
MRIRNWHAVAREGPSGIEEDCIGGQGSQWTVMLEKKKKIANTITCEGDILNLAVY